jgi:molybdopterin-guanine dinucleotide biosynthesis protein A
MQPGPIAGPTSGLILAGGRSSRMEGHNKALLTLVGRPLIGHVMDRLAPQVEALALSVEQPAKAFAVFGMPQLADPIPGHAGPLGGLLAGLRHFQAQQGWVLVLPCDAPFLPIDLAAKLLERAVESRVPAALVNHEGELQPTFSIWHHSLLPPLEQAVEGAGMAGLKQFLHTIEFARVDGSEWARPAGPPPFFNINDPAALDQASRWVLSEQRARSSCSA